jgi:DNA end-binding protein Ku
MAALRASLERAHLDRQTRPAKKAPIGGRRPGRKAPGAKAVGRGSGKTQTVKRKVAETDDLGRLTKMELYQRATAANIPGRSSMNRGELQRALARTTGRRRSQRAS